MHVECQSHAMQLSCVVQKDSSAFHFDRIILTEEIINILYLTESLSEVI